MNDRANALHSLTWLAWAVAATASIELAPNPLYVATVLAIVALVVETHRTASRTTRAFVVLLVVAIVFTLVRVVLILLTTHTGGSSFLTIPSVTLPRALGGFAIGGHLEWGVLWSSLVEGFVVIGVMATFGAFNSVASHHELMQAMPRAFHEPGLVVSVALAFVPSTVAAVETVREADRARTGGRVIRRGRSVRLVIPVLETGLERAVALAESMDSRGFGRGETTAAQLWSGWLGLGSLVSLAAAMVALVGRASDVALGLALVGVASLVAAVLLAPIGQTGHRYRPRRFTRLDWLVLAVAAAAPIGVGLCGVLGDHTLQWAGTEPLTLPHFHPLPACCLVLLAAPAFVARSAEPTASPVAAAPLRTSVAR
jgi:energy-coupling factor transport system permease protein